MAKYQLNLYKNKNLFLIIGILIIHLFFSVVFFIYKMPFLVVYNLLSSLLYGILLIIHQKKLFLILAIMAFEVPVYSSILGLMIGGHCGSIFFSFAMIPGVYLFAISLERPLLHYILISLPSVFAVFFLISWTGTPIYNETLMATELLISHRVVCIIISIFLLGYLCIGQQKELISSQRANKKYIKRLEFISDHDHLTQIPNRRCIIRRVSEMKDFMLAIFDIDNFKSINDTYGHHVGDQILCRLTRRVLSMLPEEAQMGRWGGEEFLVVYPYHKDSVRQNLEAIRSTIAEKPFGFEDFMLNVSITAGVAWSRKKNTFDEIVAEADFLLYHGKKTGKNKVVYPADITLKGR
ncbi:MAG: GGDEF domain-containing protein [Treponema sp.]|nr:GGDEF domain-containing protein [Treponema sp.]